MFCWVVPPKFTSRASNISKKKLTIWPRHRTLPQTHHHPPTFSISRFLPIWLIIKKATELWHCVTKCTGSRRWQPHSIRYRRTNQSKTFRAISIKTTGWKSLNWSLLCLPRCENRDEILDTSSNCRLLCERLKILSETEANWVDTPC